MFQTFEASTSPGDGPDRLAALRAQIKSANLDAFLVPRADAHQGEYVAPSDERLAWLTGFTGSAGFAAVTQDIAGVFIDGRYRVQVLDQVADVFTPVHWPETKLGPWLLSQLSAGSVVGFDPWLHTAEQIETLEKSASSRFKLQPCENLVDAIWLDRPAPPIGKARPHPIEYSGEKSGAKRERLAKLLKENGQSAAVITLPDSLCWLLNIRGSDIARNPVVQGFAILHADAQVSLFVEKSKLADLGPDPHVTQFDPRDFAKTLGSLTGPVRVDKATAPMAVSNILRDAGVAVEWGDDPCILPKARKNPTEIEGARAAHLRDAVAMIEFLTWLDTEAPKGRLTEIDVVSALEDFRRSGNTLQDISFDTIAGAGPNGAIVHYRVTKDTNRAVENGDLLLVDSGGQYIDGTTDITRTIAMGVADAEQKTCFTRVLQGMIAISRARWPRGLAGRDLDSLARAPLWMAGQDYDHGTGHGVGSYLSVHEGPQRLSRISETSLEPGMILSNEPGYYRAGAFGIRIENLVVVREAEKLGDNRDQLAFETLTFVPIDTRLIDTALLAPGERAWLNDYHAETREKLAHRVSDDARDWLIAATDPI